VDLANTEFKAVLSIQLKTIKKHLLLEDRTNINETYLLTEKQLG